MNNKPHEFIIRPKTGLSFINTGELLSYRDLFVFLIWRLIKVRYAQSIIGIGWAVIQPLFSMIVFTVVFGRFAKVESDGVPYALFSLAALLPWTFFSNAVTEGVGSLVSEANMIRKIYFPRIFLPLSAVAAKLVDFAIAAALLCFVMLWFGHKPTQQIAALPLAILAMISTASGISIWLTALAVQYRDVKHAMGFLVQLLMYASPVVYSTSIVPDEYLAIYSINPMVGVIETFRAAILGTTLVPWGLLATSLGSSLLLLVSGTVFFSTKEKIFADVA